MQKQDRSVEFESEFTDRHALVVRMIEHDSIRPTIRKMNLKYTLLWIGLYTGALVSTGGIWLLLSYNPRAYILIFVIVSLWFVSRLYKLLIRGSVTTAFTDRYYDITRSLAGPGFDGVQTIKLTEDNLVIADPWVRRSYHWPCARKIHRDDDRSFIELVTGEWVLIPARAFAGTDEYRAFIDEINHRNMTAGGWSKIVVDQLKIHRLRCQKCKYELHKAPEARCPECGREIIHTDFRSSTTERVN